MSVDLQVGDESWALGAPSFLFSFFSTVSARLEPAGWGTRFPVVQGELYAGELAADHAPAAAMELAQIREELRAFPPSDLVWDVEDRSKRPPWGDDISPDVTDLSNYWVTSGEGEDLFDVLLRGCARAQATGEAIRLR